MVKFRRSRQSESSGGKHDSAKPVQISIPQKDAIAIEPPKKVIKALYDYTASTDTSHYLSFSAGDFLHVVSRENDPDWYEACNPLQNTRGLVPVKYFEEVGKTVRDSEDSTKSSGTTHDSGYAEGSTTRSVAASRNSTMSSGNAPPMPIPGHRMSKSFGGGKQPAGVYGVVCYDFNAERPDELEAKEGEAIIVIAQSNPEWFVAKPITRLGGPGLIPVSFIEIRDMTTGKAAEDPVAAVQKAGIPRVEEWKKMAAEYKNTSIPLGTVSSSQQQAQSLTQGMDRMSLQNGGYGHERTGSNAYQLPQQGLHAPLRASVPKYIFADDKFHFVVEAKMVNNAHWDLSRIYEDFYELQINLINAFPEEAGQVPGKSRTLPYMPGPVKFVTDNISEGRRENLDQYLRDLLNMGQHITNSALVCTFFAPRDGDFEVDPNSTDINEHARPTEPQQRYSQASQNPYSHGEASPQEHSRQGSIASNHQHSKSQASNTPYNHQRGQPSLSANNGQQPPYHYRTPSEFTGPPQSSTQPPQSSPSKQPPSTTAVKVKAWFDRDTCVVLRMPPRGGFSYDNLYQKIVERRKLEFRGAGEELLEIEYRDERDGEYYRLEGDEDLEIAVERNDKLTLAVRAAGS